VLKIDDGMVYQEDQLGAPKKPGREKDATEVGLKTSWPQTETSHGTPKVGILLSGIGERGKPPGGIRKIGLKDITRAKEKGE